MKKRFILFDFDGVIADSFHIAFSTNKVICPSITEEDYRKRFEGNINEIKHQENFHDSRCDHGLDWFEIYVPRMKKDCKLFPGMKELILRLKSRYVLIIISSTITSPIEEFLATQGIREHFDWVMGNDVHKSKVEKIKMVFEKFDIGPQDCLFITDTLGDIHEARETGISSIGVTWGFCKTETLQKGEPLALVNEPAELERMVMTHLPSKKF